MYVATATVEDILGGKKILKKSLKNSFDEIDLIEKGIPIAALKAFIKLASFTLDDISNFLHVSRRTLERKQTLDANLGDDLIQIAGIYAKGFEVFEDKNLFIKWVNMENRALGGKNPKQLLGTSVGRGMIKDVLGRIEHGVYS